LGRSDLNNLPKSTRVQYSARRRTRVLERPNGGIDLVVSGPDKIIRAYTGLCPKHLIYRSAFPITDTYKR
ncbi:MAG: hypothetical protein V3R25_02105, partial [Nitrosomonadaceae bacterium]